MRRRARNIRRPRSGRSRAAVLLALLLGVGAVPAASLAAAPPAEAATTAAPSAVITVAPHGSGVLQSKKSLTVTVSIRNTGTGTLPAGTLRLSASPTVLANAAEVAKSVAAPASVQGYDVGDPVATPAITSGGERVVQVTLSATPLDSALGSTPGARIITARLTAGGATTRGAAAVTVLGSGILQHITVGTVVPITAPTTTDGLVPAAELTELTAESGAWTEALQAAEGTDATIALDPAIVASITTLGDTAPQSAIAFLAALREAGNTTFSLPYADSDLALERAAGLQKPLGVLSLDGNVDAADFSAAPTTAPTDAATASPTPTATSSVSGAPTTAELLDFPYSTTSVAWPYPGSLTKADLDFAADGGATTSIVASGDVKDSAARLAAGPLAKVDGHRALVADSTLSAMLADASGTDATASDAALADLVAGLAADATSGAATRVLITAPRADPAAGTLGEALTELQNQSWIHDTDLAGMLKQSGTVSIASAGTQPPSQRVSAAKSLLASEQDVRELAKAVSPASAFVGPQRLLTLRALSNAWHTDTAAWPLTEAANAMERVATRSVTVQESSTVNFVGSASDIPVTVVNHLDQAVTVVVDGAPSNSKLVVRPSAKTVVPAGTATKVPLPITSISNGRLVLRLTASTPDGWQIGGERTVAVNVNAAWETIGAVVFFALIALLFGTGVYRNVTRRRRALRRAAARRAAQARTGGDA